MLRAIVFDIDNTLFPSNDFAEYARRNALTAMIEAGMDVDENTAYKKLRHVIERYGPNYPQHFNILLKELGVKHNPKIIAAGIVAYHQAKTGIFPYPDVPKTIISLRERGYKLCIASEGKALKQWDKLIRLGLHNMFHEVFVTPKKTGHFYKSILDKLKLKPQEVLMVGDRLDKDILPAKSLGIKTVLVAHEHAGKGADYSVRNFGELLKIIERLEK
ncbi:MAG: HAD family hydrolase [Candidatus Micrarchaeota archaeon]|nr:HAD family hydrolase [Candidatus Micrarchaeota archaeon]